MPCRREDLEAQGFVSHHVDVLLRHRRQFSPELVEGVAVQPARAALEPGGVDEVRRADLGDVHLQSRMLADEDARRARMVEVDVAEEQMTHVLEREAVVGQSLLQ